MPLRGPLRQMREQNYAGGITGRRDLMHLEFRAFTRRKREQIIKKWSKCTGRWAAGAARGMPCVVHVSHDWYRHQCTPERLLMKQLPRICLLPDSMVFFQTLLSKYDERAQMRWWQPWRPFWGILHVPQTRFQVSRKESSVYFST